MNDTIKATIGEALRFEASRLIATRGALDKAAGEASAARQRVEEATAAERAAEHAYDDDASDDNAAKLIAARQGRELATVRAERAARREASARADLDAAELAAKRARAAAALGSTFAAEERAREALSDARATAEHARPAAKLRSVLAFAAEQESAARGGLDAAAAKHGAALDALLSAESEALDLLPEDLRESIGEAAEQRRAEERDRLTLEGSAEAFHARLEGDMETMALAVEMIAACSARMLAALGEQHATARLASELGCVVTPLDSGHVIAAHVLALRQARTLEATGGDLSKAIRFGFGIMDSTFEQRAAYRVRTLGIVDPLMVALEAWRAALDQRATHPGEDAPPAPFDHEMVSRLLRSASAEDAAGAFEEVREARKEQGRAERRKLDEEAFQRTADYRASHRVEA